MTFSRPMTSRTTTHIGPIAALTNAYPYGNLDLGQVIGRNYFLSEEANFNANFWASDGFAAMGIAGVPVVTAVVCLIWAGINRAARGFSTKFTVLWLAGFWQTLLNAPISVALLSGGGLIVMSLLALNSSLRESEAQDTSTMPEPDLRHWKSRRLIS